MTAPRRPLALASIALALALGPAAPPAEAQAVTAELVATPFGNPVDLAAPPGDLDRLFIVDKRGVVKIALTASGAVLGTPFLDIQADVNDAGEGGLLSLAFHPDYAQNGRFYVSYTRGDGSDSTVSEFTVSAGNPNVADPASEQFVWGPFPQGGSASHKGGCLRFGPDGMLYFSIGDGGCCNDPFGHAQNLLDPRGKVLRFDVDAPPPHVPADNPFVGDPTALDEIWAYGMRNPWRIDVDPGTGDLWVGDVGETTREELTRVPAGMGGANLGWRCMEGTVCSGLSGCTCNAPEITLPTHEYGPDGCAVVCGAVYRGSAIPSLRGHLFFTDFCDNQMTSFRYADGQVQDFVNQQPYINPDGSLKIHSIACFGRGGDGELYFANYFGGRVFKLVPGVPPPWNYCTAVPSSTGRSARMGWSGTTSVSQNDLVLEAHDLPFPASALFFYGFAPDETPLGNGNLCVSARGLGFVLRLEPGGLANAAGVFTRALDLTDPPDPLGQIVPGATAYFSCWYRDVNGGGSLFNFADGLGVTFQP